MRIKSYFADSVPEAIGKARTELGPEAMLMNSKKTDFELRALGSLEVVFGLPGQTPAAKPRLQMKSGGAPADDSSLFGVAPGGAVPGTSGESAQELAELRRQVETVRRSVNRKQRVTTNADEKHTPASDHICARLRAADISEDLAQEIAEAVELQALSWQQTAPRGLRDLTMIPSENIELALTAELERRLQVAPELGVAGAAQKSVMFVGPAGAGKTTCLIKLGLRFGLQARLPMHILSLDTLRVGGWEHLAAYARIAGLGFDAVHNLATLEQFLLQHSDKKLILIDTPGFGPSDGDEFSDLGCWLSRSASIDVQLVIPATLRQAVFHRTVERYSPLKPAKLLLTREDEMESPGVLLDVALRSGLPLSYISNGQTIPEDIQQASKQNLMAPVGIRKQARAKQEAA